VSETKQTTQPTCWCCGREVEGEADVVRLGNHPEVALCLNCARWTARRAKEQRDRGRTGPAVKARSVVRGARGYVVGRGLQTKPVIGPVLRWVDRFLP